MKHYIGCLFNLTEKEVDETSRDIAKFLKRLGYIRLKEDEMIVKKDSCATK